MFKKLFGKKNDGFYLQLEDDNNTPKPAAKAPAQPPASTPKAAPAPAVATPAPAPVAATPAPAAATSDTAAKKSVKKSVKKTEAEPKVAQTPAPAPLPAAPAPAAPAITNFSTDYLIKPSSMSSRRRPGANMNSYLDMARQAKKPEAFKK